MRHEPVFQGRRYVVLDVHGVTWQVKLPASGLASWRRVGDRIEFRHSYDGYQWRSVGSVRVE